MSFIEKQIAKGLSPREACKAFARMIGFYAFNRWAAKQGLHIGFVLSVHGIRPTKKI